MTDYNFELYGEIDGADISGIYTEPFTTNGQYIDGIECYVDSEEDYARIVFTNNNLTITTIDGDWDYGNSDVVFGTNGTNTFISFEENLSAIYSTNLEFNGNCSFIVGSVNSILFDDIYDVSGTVNIIIRNGIVPTGSILSLSAGKIDEDYSFVNSNPLYNYAFRYGKIKISPKTSAEIQTAGFTASQANRLVEIMNTEHGVDPTNDEIVKLAQMGDIAGAKQLLGGEAPVIKQRQAYLNGKMRQVFVNGKQRNIYVGVNNE